MTPKYPALAEWAGLPRLDADQFFERFPLAGEAYDAGEDDFYDGDIDDLEFIVIGGDVSISRAQLEDMAAALDDDWTLRIAVDGNAQVEGGAAPLFAVKGDLHCDWLGIDRTWDTYSVQGRVYARDCVFVTATDEGWMLTLPATRITTPFLFLWNFEPDTIDLNPEAVMFVLGFEWGGSTLPNRCYAHKEIVHVLDSRVLKPFTCEYTEEDVIDSRAVIDALAAGESIYRDGFDIACEEAMREAAQAMIGEDFRRAYFLYRKAVALSPQYYPAHIGMAHAMARAGAKSQALDLYVQASAYFPPEQTGLVNEALNRAALFALRLGRLDLADALAAQSLAFTRESGWNDTLLAEACWIGAEISIARGKTAAARSLLNDALAFAGGDPHANWLMGLLCYQCGEHERARAYHAKALRRWTAIPYYDVASSYAPPFTSVEVDWDGPGAVAPAGS